MIKKQWLTKLYPPNMPQPNTYYLLNNKQGKKWITKIIHRAYDNGYYYYDSDEIDLARLYQAHEQYGKLNDMQYRCIRFRCHENKIHHDHYNIRIINLNYQTRRSLPTYDVEVKSFNGTFKLKLIRKQKVLDLIKMLESPDVESAILGHDILAKLKVI